MASGSRLALMNTSAVQRWRLAYRCRPEEDRRSSPEFVRAKPSALFPPPTGGWASLVLLNQKIRSREEDHKHLI